MSFYSLPIPAPGNICLITCLLISSLPEPFPDNSVFSFVWICLVSTHACPRLCLLPAPPVPQPIDSRFRPTPVHWTSNWIIVITTVCPRTILDCCYSLDYCVNKEHQLFAPEFCLAIGSSYRTLTLTHPKQWLSSHFGMPCVPKFHQASGSYGKCEINSTPAYNSAGWKICPIMSQHHKTVPSASSPPGVGSARRGTKENRNRETSHKPKQGPKYIYCGIGHNSSFPFNITNVHRYP